MGPVSAKGSTMRRITIFPFVVVLALATTGCASMMEYSESVMRDYAKTGGAFSGAAQFSADVHRNVRHGVFGESATEKAAKEKKEVVLDPVPPQQ
jgi:hypothetical protein